MYDDKVSMKYRAALKIHLKWRNTLYVCECERKRGIEQIDCWPKRIMEILFLKIGQKKQQDLKCIFG